MLKHISTEKPFKLFSIKSDEYVSYKKNGVELAMNGIYYDWYVNDIYHDIELYIRPYLRPMSSMTEDEISDLQKINCQFNFSRFDNFAYIGAADDGFCSVEDMNNILNYLYKHHLDYHGLIEKGLAIEVTEDNNPYKD